jgi:hypothetical protein
MKHYIKKYNKTKKAKKNKKLTRGGEYNNFGYSLIPNASKELYQEEQHRLPLYEKPIDAYLAQNADPNLVKLEEVLIEMENQIVSSHAKGNDINCMDCLGNLNNVLRNIKSIPQDFQTRINSLRKISINGLKKRKFSIYGTAYINMQFDLLNKLLNKMNNFSLTGDDIVLFYNKNRMNTDSNRRLIDIVKQLDKQKQLKFYSLVYGRKGFLGFGGKTRKYKTQKRM